MPSYVVVTVRDRAIDTFGRPFVVPALGAAVRGFTDEVNNSQSDLFKHSDDYDLYELGVFDDQTGLFDMLPAPRMVVTGKSVLRVADTPSYDTSVVPRKLKSV